MSVRKRDIKQIQNRSRTPTAPLDLLWVLKGTDNSKSLKGELRPNEKSRETDLGQKADRILSAILVEFKETRVHQLIETTIQTFVRLQLR